MPQTTARVKPADESPEDVARLLAALAPEERVRLARIAVRLADGRRADAEDILQGAYLRALQYPHRLAGVGESAVPGRLQDLMVKEVEVLRRRLRRERPVDLAGEPALGGEPEAHAEHAQERNRMLGVLAELPARDRRVLVLRAGGLAHAEVGAAIGSSENGAAKAMERAGARARALRGELESGARCRRLRPLAPAHAVGGLGSAQSAEVRRHLRVCAGSCPRVFARANVERAHRAAA